jgi:hypothetical protein
VNVLKFNKWWFVLSLLVFFGCDDSEVQSYRVPKEKVATPAVLSAPSGQTGHGGPQQMFAAIVPQGGQFWFFKVTGDEHFLAPIKPQIVDFLKSVVFEGDQPTWTLPAGWNQQPGSNMRFATLVIADASHSAEMSVIALPQTPILPQVNRWRSQLGLNPITDMQLETDVEHLDANGIGVTLVSLVGEGSGTMSPPFASGASQLPPDHPAVSTPIEAPSAPSTVSRGPLSYQIPSGWQEQPASGMRVATIKIGEAELTIIPLAAAAGDLVANVNRWRGQVGLDSRSSVQIEQDCPVIDLGGTPGRLVELVGTTGQSMLGVIAVRDDKAWFVKLLAPSSIVVEEKENFRSFIQTITFN